MPTGTQSWRAPPKEKHKWQIQNDITLTAVANNITLDDVPDLGYFLSVKLPPQYFVSFTFTF